MHAQGPHNGHALLLPARKLAGVAVCLCSQPHPLQQRHGLFFHLGLIPLLHFGGGQQNVFHHGKMRKKFVALKHHADLLAQRGRCAAALADLAAPQGDRAALYFLQGIDASQQRAFSAAARPHDHDHLALAHLQIDSV